eukprot:GEMP01027338.1.p1 GENE.GEMP01027338.1~~GEMP01027338.1.p1  ORF type:complete len:417 (+),score=48.28 GEMP01027338.1:23-1273(+)
MGWKVGAFLCILSCFVANFGLLLQKQALIRVSTAAGHETRSSWRNPRWVLGFFIFILGQLISVQALSLTPQSVLGALSGFSLVSNSFLAPVMLGEKCTYMHLLSTIMLVSGSICVVSFASSPANNGDLTMERVESLLRRPQAVAVFVGSISFVGALYIRGRVAVMHRTSPLTKQPYPADPFTFAITSAILGAFSVTMTKGASTVLRTEYSENPAVLYHPILALMMAFGISCAVSSVWALNMGIFYYDALYIIPLYYSLALLFQSGFGGAIYDEFSSMNTVQVAGFLSGVVVNVLGVWTLSIANAVEVANTPFVGHLRRAKSCPGEFDSVDQASELRKRSLKAIFRRSFSFDIAIRDSEHLEAEPSRPLLQVRALNAVDEVIGQFADGGARLWVLQTERFSQRDPVEDDGPSAQLIK